MSPSHSVAPHTHTGAILLDTLGQLLPIQAGLRTLA